jgi:selenocysteine-specific elongation factor
LRSRLRVEAKRMEILVGALVAEGDAALRGSRVARAGFEPRLSAQNEVGLANLQRRFQASPESPPVVREARQALGDELWALLVARGEFVEVSSEVAFDSATYARLVGEITDGLRNGGTLTVAEVRDRYGTSRKYALALLEHLDAIGVTVRVGDARTLRRSNTE